MNSVAIFDTISKISLYLIVALIPLWFLPITQNILGYQKQAFLVALVLIGFISWLAAMVYRGEVSVRVSWLHAAVLGVLAAMGISTLFSSFPYASFWGFPLDTTDNLVTFLGFFLLYFFVGQAPKTKKHIQQLFSLFLVSCTFAVVFAVVQLKGILLVPFDFAQSAGFNTLGGASTVALIAALLLPLAIALASSSFHATPQKQNVWKGIVWASAIVLFSSLMLLDFFAAWIVAMTGLLVVFAFDALRPRVEKAAGRRISLPMVFVLIALFFVVVGDFSIPGAPVKPAAVSPSYRGELAIAREAVSENSLQAVVGTGPGTFVYDYAKFRPAETNQSVFWSTRFSKGKAEILDWGLTKGILGVLALFVFLGLAGTLLVRTIMQGKRSGGTSSHEDDISVQDMFAPAETHNMSFLVGLLAVLTGFAVGLFVYPANFMVWFVFWMAAAGIAFFVSKEKTISLSTGPSAAALAASVTLMVVLIAGVALAFVGSQKYYAEVVYARGADAAAIGDTDRAIERIRDAAGINGSIDLYWRDLAQLYVAQARQIAANTELSVQDRQQQTRAAVNNAIQAAQRATEVGKANVANWNVRGFVYRSLIGVPDADTFAIESYMQAAVLEPVSPFPWTELGRVKILSAQAGGNQNRAEDAVADLEKAVALKPDYAPAHYLLAVALDRLGSTEQAIAKLEETRIVAPNDVGLAFQLGVIYYRQNELGKARDELERAKLVNPKYSNARYMLGLTYDRLGRKEDARAEFAAVAVLNPDNQEVRDILANLSAGRAALDGIGQPGTPPIQDNPEEIETEPQ